MSTLAFSSQNISLKNISLSNSTSLPAVSPTKTYTVSLNTSFISPQHTLQNTLQLDPSQVNSLSQHFMPTLMLSNTVSPQQLSAIQTIANSETHLSMLHARNSGQALYWTTLSLAFITAAVISTIITYSVGYSRGVMRSLRGREPEEEESPPDSIKPRGGMTHFGRGVRLDDDLFGRN